MKALVEIVKFNLNDVVTASGGLCDGETPVITPGCDTIFQQS